MLNSAFYKKLNELLLELLTQVPEPQLGRSLQDSDDLIKTASLKAAAISGTLSLPAGVLAALTLLPDMVAVWKIQAQLVADIAQAHNKHNQLTREMLLYCLFGSGQSAADDLVVRIGQRFIVRRSSQKVFESFLGKIALRIGRSLVGDRIARWIPFVGALLVARYAFKDTEKVGVAAKELFGSTIELH